MGVNGFAGFAGNAELQPHRLLPLTAAIKTVGLKEARDDYLRSLRTTTRRADSVSPCMSRFDADFIYALFPAAAPI